MSIRALPDHRQLLTISQAAKQLNVSVQTLRDWTDDDRIDAFVTDGNHRRYQQSDVEQLALQTQAQAQGRVLDMKLLHASLVVSREGDLYTIQDFPAEHWLNQDFAEVKDYNFERLPADEVQTQRTWEKLQNSVSVSYQLELQYFYTGQAQCNVGDIEIGGKYDDAHASVWTTVVAPDHDTLQQQARVAVQQAVEKLAALEPVVGIISYTLDGQRIRKFSE